MRPVIRGYFAVTVTLLFAYIRLNAGTPPKMVHFTGIQVRLEEVLDSIRVQTDYDFECEDTKLLNLRVTVNIPKGLPIDEFLKVAFSKYHVSYTINGSIISLSQKNLTRPPATKPVRRQTDVRIAVIDEAGNPLPKTSLLFDGANEGFATDRNGFYHFTGINEGSVLHISHVSMKPDVMVVKYSQENTIFRMVKMDFALESVINNGYQRTGKERATGSVDLINNKLFNRGVSSNWTDRLENLSPGLLYNHGGQGANGNQGSDPILIHGRSTIYANAAPLYVLDDFPYDGNPANINPNDIENVTILKDAAATSIWGVRAGNGVIVLTSKKGRGDSARVVFNNNITFSPRANLSDIHSLSSTDDIEFEKKLYMLGYYPSAASGALVTPVVALLQTAGNGPIPASVNAQIESMKKFNVSDEIGRYFYRSSINREHYVQVSGRSPSIRYFFSGGWDHNLSDLSETRYDRMTLRMQNTFTLTPHLQLDAGLNIAENIQQNGNNPGSSLLTANGAKNLYPYARLADAQGHPLPVNLYYPSSFIQQATQSGLLNWDYSPLADLSAEKNTITTNDKVLNFGARYTLLPSLNLDVKYQNESQSVVTNDLHGASSYYVRDLVNYFTQVDPVTHVLLSRPIPAGGILDLNTTRLSSQQGRAQLNYHQYLHNIDELTALGGYEIKSVLTTVNSNRFYGYDPTSLSSDLNIDYRGLYPPYPGGSGISIPTAAPSTQTTDHFISYFSNAAYNYHGRFTLSGSVRDDMANIFGIVANHQGVPLWSAGLSWKVDTGKFFHPNWLPSLKLRSTYGSNGNLSRLGSAYTTALYAPGGFTGTPYNTGIIQSLSNANLRWERVKILNFGVDFATRDTVISGTVEYYRKWGVDIMAPNIADPTLGLIQNPGLSSYYYSNQASMRGRGVDLQLQVRILRGPFQWTADGVYSYASSIISSFPGISGAGNSYLDPTVINAVKGKPVFGLYSYKWRGLDPKTGDPIGELNGEASKEWASIYANTPIDSMVYNGPAQPTSFGALRNTFSRRNFSLSFNISYKFGYYFRKPGLDYQNIATNWNGSDEYDQRWLRPGDERKTHVPSMVYPFVQARDNFYRNSSVLVLKADNIRLEDVRLDYELDRSHWPGLPFRRLVLYGVVSNFGLLWRANKEKIDPYYINTPREGKHFSLGATIHF